MTPRRSAAPRSPRPFPAPTLALACAVLALASAPIAADGDLRPVWVFFADKADAAGFRVPWAPPDRVGSGPDLDLSLDDRYVRQVESLGLTVRVRSRWFNAVTVLATENQVGQLAGLPFVSQVRPVLSRGHRTEPGAGPHLPSPAPSGRSAAGGPEYGPSLEQAAAIGLPALHALDVRGQGVRIALLDAGFNWTHQRAFAGLVVLAARDFVNGDDDVEDEAQEPVTGDEARNGQNLHGTRVLGVLAGNDPGQLVGVAPAAQYLLAKTEDLAREPAAEEDRWISGLEWADSLGAQVVNSSLGYTVFDDGSGYTYADLDGQTALTTRAAELAVARGVIVVASVGNRETDWQHLTLPADGAHVIAVGAVHPVSGAIATFSSRGPTADGRIKPDLVAPGQQVVTVAGRSGQGISRFDLGEYQQFDGTSFAAPFVSGACALLLQLNPEWPPARVLEALRSTAADLGAVGPDTVFGWGLVDLPRASGLQLPTPRSSAASPPFPNPLRDGGGTVYFPLELVSAEEVSISVFDAGGALIDQLPTRRLPPGRYTARASALSWAVADRLASGVYLYSVQGTTFRREGKVAVLRGP